MRTKIFILCAGKSTRFNGVTKQLLPLNNNETILGRIIKQTKNYNTSVVTRNSKIIDFCTGQTDIILPSKYAKTCESALSTENKWCNGHNIILLGDVVYSKSTIDKILSDTSNLIFFGDMAETYAISFFNKEWASNALYVGSLCSYGKLRHAYRRAVGLLCNDHYTREELEKCPYFEYIDDFITRDCDTEQEYKQLIKEVINRGYLERGL